MSFQFFDIPQYHQALASGQSSCEQAVLHYLETIKANQKLNAFTVVFEQEALERAKQLDEQRNSQGIIGRLHGVVVAVKDVICIKDQPVTAGSKMLEGF